MTFLELLACAIKVKVYVEMLEELCDGVSICVRFLKQTNTNGLIIGKCEEKKGEGENAERPIFRNLKIANVKITKDELIDCFIFEFFRNYLR